MNTLNKTPIFVSHTREKLVQSVVFFAQNTRYLGKVKLFKLLYLMDFEHFRQTGRSVTGLEYNAWKMGPVPVPLMDEWEQMGNDLRGAVAIEPQKVFDYTRETVVARSPFDDRHFTRRELEIMESLALKYRDTKSGEMIDVTHAQNGAWATVWNDGEGYNQPISYDLSLPVDSPDRDRIMEAAAEYAVMARRTEPAHA